MSKNSKLITIGKGEADYINLLNKNLFFEGGDYNIPLVPGYLNGKGYTNPVGIPQLLGMPQLDYYTLNTNNVYGNVKPAINQLSSWEAWHVPESLNVLSVQGLTLSGHNPLIPNNILIDSNKALLDIANLTYLPANRTRLSGSTIANKALGAATGVMLIGLLAVELAGKLQRDAAQLLINSLIALLNSTLLDLSSNRNLLNSISGATTINMFDKNNFLSSKGLAAKGIIGTGLSGATTGLFVGGPWGALIGGLAGLGAGITGRLIGRKKAIKAANEMNAKATEANALLYLRINNAVLLQNQQHALASASNILAYGGSLKEGDEIELTKELIAELEKLGYKLEY